MNRWNVRRWFRLRIEGFQLPQFLTQCKNQDIGFQSIRIIDECTMEVSIDARDLSELHHLAGNRYRITILGQSGLESRFRIFFSRISTCIGLVLFLGIIIYQSMFISQVQIRGVERLTELEVRTALEDLGLYPGAWKSYDVLDLKTELFHVLDQVTWVGITFEGTKAIVEILEGAQVPPLEDISFPAHIVSDREGYLEEIMVKEGVALKAKGDFVAPGDVIISGEVPITDRSYQREEDELIRRVHAQGEVKLRVLHKHTLYQPKYTTVLDHTGRWIPGISIRIGTWSFDSDRLLRPWETSRREVVAAGEWIRPIPLSIQVYRSEEVKVLYSERSEQEVLARTEQQIRWIFKEKLPKDAELIKKDLSFSEKENIIIVYALLHSLETVGVDQPIPQ